MFNKLTEILKNYVITRILQNVQPMVHTNIPPPCHKKKEKKKKTNNEIPIIWTKGLAAIQMHRKPNN